MDLTGKKSEEGVFISEADQYLFAQGTHYDIYKKLGAHPSVENGKKGMSAANLYKIAVALSTSCDYILLGVHRIDDVSRLESLYEEFLKRFNDEQRKYVVKILKTILEMSQGTI